MICLDWFFINSRFNAIYQTLGVQHGNCKRRILERSCYIVGLPNCPNEYWQKSFGAEGERLKEATNINKSLSTLGLVSMNLCQCVKWEISTCQAHIFTSGSLCFMNTIAPVSEKKYVIDEVNSLILFFNLMWVKKGM